MTSQKSGSETCDTSTIMPSRSISSMMRRPTSVSPRLLLSSPEEPPIGLAIDHVSVR
jgi:hypothetical protein